MNPLHLAARYGSVEGAVAALNSGFDIDQGDTLGFTPLMFAAVNGNPHVVRVLLNRGANVSIVAGRMVGPVLHHAAAEGHVSIVEMLIKAGADVDWMSPVTGTPLHLAVEAGNAEVARALIEAGANVDSRKADGETPLFAAARGGQVEAARELLRANANPRLTHTSSDPSQMFSPLDVAAQGGHSGVVRELAQHFGIEGCGGESGGVFALSLAAQMKHLNIMAILSQAGVVDTGEALVSAAAFGGEASAKFLLQQHQQHQQQPQAGGTRHDGAYVNFRSRLNAQTPLVGTVVFESCSPRTVRLLVDAGADTSSPVRPVDLAGEAWFDGTPLALTNCMLRKEIVFGETDDTDPTEERLLRLQAIRRLLMTVDAVHAISWLWPSETPPTTHVTEGTATRLETGSTPLRTILPIMRRRAGRPRVLLAALFRWVVAS